MNKGLDTKCVEIDWKGHKALRFTAGGYEATIVPEVGANLISLRKIEENIEILRSPDDITFEQFAERPQVYGLPVLFPPNRIEDGTFTVEGKVYHFPITEIPRNNHCHGFLHKRAWEVEQIIELTDSVKVQLVVKNDETTDFYEYYPNEFTFYLTYELNKDGLKQNIRIINNGKEKMPMGLGFHTAFKIPFHPQGESNDYKMFVSIGDKWELNDRILPTGVITEPKEEEKEYTKGGVPPVGHIIDLQHFIAKPLTFKGKSFNGAYIEDAKNKFRLVYDCDKKYEHWMLWNMDGKSGFVCPEPQTWAINAPNIPGRTQEETGLQIIEPGQEFTADARIYVEKI